MKKLGYKIIYYFCAVIPDKCAIILAAKVTNKVFNDQSLDPDDRKEILSSNSFEFFRKHKKDVVIMSIKNKELFKWIQ